MSVSNIIDASGVIAKRYLPDPYPYPASSGLGAVLAVSGNALSPTTNLPQPMSNVGNIGCANIQAPFGSILALNSDLIQNGVTANLGILPAGNLTLKGGQTKGNILAGDGTSTVGLPLGTTGYVLKANPATATGLEWAIDISGVTGVVGVNAGANIDISGTVSQPIVSLQSPLTSTLNMGAVALQDISGATGTSGQFLSAGAGGQAKWATPAYPVVSVVGGTNIDVSGTTTSTVSLENPLTAQLNIGSQTLLGATNSGTDTTSLNINVGSAVNGLVQLTYGNTDPALLEDGFVNISTDAQKVSRGMRWETNDGVSTTITTLLTETAQNNVCDKVISIIDSSANVNTSGTYIVNGSTNGGFSDRNFQINNADGSNADRRENTSSNFGIVDFDKCESGSGIGFRTGQETRTVTFDNVSDVLNYNDGAGTTTAYSHTCNSSNSSISNSATSGGATLASQIVASPSLVQHQMRRTAGTQNAYVQNNAQINLSRLQGQLIDTGVGNYSTIDTTNSQCEIRQQVLVGGTTKNTSLLTTNALTTLSTDAPLNITTSGNNLNLLSAVQMGLQATSGAMFLNANSGSGRIAMSVGGNTRLDLDTINTTLTNPSGSGGGTTTILGSGVVGKPALILTNQPSNLTNNPTTLEMYYNKSIAGATGDIVTAINFYGEDASTNKVQLGGIESVLTQANPAVGTGPDGAMDFYTNVNGAKSLVMRLNGADNENNFFRPLDMNGQDVKTSSGNMGISTASSTGTGAITITPKAGQAITIPSSADPTNDFISINPQSSANTQRLLMTATDTVTSFKSSIDLLNTPNRPFVELKADFGGAINKSIQIDANGAGSSNNKINAYDGQTNLPFQIDASSYTNGSIELKVQDTTGDLIFTSTNLQSASAGANSGQHLRIKLNGTYFKIALLDD